MHFTVFLAKGLLNLSFLRKISDGQADIGSDSSVRFNGGVIDLQACPVIEGVAAKRQPQQKKLVEGEHHLGQAVMKFIAGVKAGCELLRIGARGPRGGEAHVVNTAISSRQQRVVIGNSDKMRRICQQTPRGEVLTKALPGGRQVTAVVANKALVNEIHRWQVKQLYPGIKSSESGFTFFEACNMGKDPGEGFCLKGLSALGKITGRESEMLAKCDRKV